MQDGKREGDNIVTFHENLGLKFVYFYTAKRECWQFLTLACLAMLVQLRKQAATILDPPTAMTLQFNCPLTQG